jgi:hypothetical protein
MDLMAEISKPDCGSIEVEFGPAPLIQPLVSERDFHENTALTLGAAKQNQSIVAIRPVPLLPMARIKAECAATSFDSFRHDDVIPSPLQLINEHGGIVS